MYSQAYSPQYSPAPYLAPVPQSAPPAQAAPAPGQYSPMGVPMPTPQYGQQAYQQMSPPTQGYSQPFTASTPNSYRAATAAQLGLAQQQQLQQNADQQRSAEQFRIAQLEKAIEFLMHERELAQNAISKLAPFMMTSIVLGEMSVGQDALIDKLSKFLMSSVLLGEFSAGQDALIGMLCGLLQDPYFLAGHYLDLEKRLGELPSVVNNFPQQQNQFTPPTVQQFTSPAMQQARPPVPPPMPVASSGAAGFTRDTLRQMWEHSPGMAWKFVNQINPTEWARQPLFQ